MIDLISHRGNLTGPNSAPGGENSIEAIFKARKEGLTVEVDLWYDEDGFMLGHDAPQYSISNVQVSDLSCMDPVLWHAKNIQAAYALHDKFKMAHFFFHESDPHTLTSKGLALTHPDTIKKSGFGPCFNVWKDGPLQLPDFVRATLATKIKSLQRTYYVITDEVVAWKQFINDVKEGR